MVLMVDFLTALCLRFNYDGLNWLDSFNDAECRGDPKRKATLMTSSVKVKVKELISDYNYNRFNYCKIFFLAVAGRINEKVFKKNILFEDCDDF